MAIVGLLVEDCKTVSSSISKIKTKLEDSNYVNNPFSGSTHLYNVEHEGEKRKLLILSIKPIYINFSIFGWVLGIILFFSFGFIWWLLLPCLILITLGFFWSDKFYSIVLKKSLRKGGYKGIIKSLSMKHSLLLLIESGRVH